MSRSWGFVGSSLAVALVLGQSAQSQQRQVDDDGIASYSVVGDAVDRPLTEAPADAARGRRIALDRRLGNCLICHRVPEPDERFQGDLGPDLAGVGTRLSKGQIRLRLVDLSRLNSATLMPPYHRVEGLHLVDAAYQGRPALTAAQIEDVVAYLAALKE